jgi:hypothetical protein
MWIRAKNYAKYHSLTPRLFSSSGIKPIDVVQGGFVKCSLLAVAASLAEKPERIDTIFTNS